MPTFATQPNLRGVRPLDNADSPRTERLLAMTRQIARVARSMRESIQDSMSQSSDRTLSSLMGRVEKMTARLQDIRARLEQGETTQAIEQRLRGIAHELRSVRDKMVGSTYVPGRREPLPVTTAPRAGMDGLGQVPDGEEGAGTQGAHAIASLAFLTGAGLLFWMNTSTEQKSGDDPLPAGGALIGQS